jgi:ribosomal protein L11 methyltransferase
VVEEQPAAQAPTLRAFFPDALPPGVLETRVREYVASLGALGFAAATPPAITLLADRNWGEAWRAHFRPLPVGRRLLVAPPWDVPAASDRLVLVVEPGRAFGTGHHGSTAGCLGLLERALDEAAAPPTAIDLGTGSGILAVAAARLGVGRILAIDEDSDAVAVAAANAEVNGVAARIECRVADAAALQAVASPLVLANLLSAAHFRLAARYRALLSAGGLLVLGGILDAEADAVREHVRGHGLAPAGALSIDGWTSLGFRAPVHDRA